MIQNFDELKKQLEALSGVINGFKSEAVQLKIIEMIFSSRPITLPEVIAAPLVTETSRASASPVKKKRAAPEAGKRTTARASSGAGAVATLLKTFESDFFSQPRTINAILQHCETNLARKIRANEISGKLARMVRSNHLKRAKNSDGQYEYINY